MSLMALFLFLSCENGSDDNPADADVEIQDYMWKGMNAYYLWQPNVSVLSDTRFETQGDLNDYLADKGDLMSFFYNDLVYRYGETDRFSWIVDDYIALENSFSGISLSNGVEFGLFVLNESDDNVYGVVRYILPNSDASTKNIKRGDIFNRVNGTQMTRGNYNSLLFGNDDYTLGLADYNDGSPIANDVEIALSKSQYTENPVFLQTVIENGSSKVGYLMYNSFISNFDSQLNTAFGELKSAGVNELVLDLRYNGGGSVRSATYLASMITGQYTGQIFTTENWNPKVMDYFDTLSESERKARLEKEFPDKIAASGELINSLGLNKVYVITTRSTASASELVINGLLPYIDVVVVGTQGTGKFVASTTLYDSDDFTRNGDNLASHTYAMQPIILEDFNANGENNGVVGFLPDLEIAESYGNMGVLGDAEEPLLSKALEDIFGVSSKSSQPQEFVKPLWIGESKENRKDFQKMYAPLPNQ